MKQRIEKFYSNNETYFQTLMFIGFIWGYGKSIIDMIEAVLEANSILFAILMLFLWQIIAMVNAVLTALLVAIVWGAVLFIPYKAVAIFIKGKEQKDEE